ncbi:hypothetical protein C8Q80DRAFT_1276257 [Daedaleopsis nitida]|nr:hypothetical protein C8Q80DRAFT_1276257 [Daedaleopsis nitida]
MAPHLSLLSLSLILAPLARAFQAPTIPLNWTTIAACAVDNPSRILANDITTQVANNTPAACVASCAAQGFGYAGVEFGNECHCGSGLADVVQPAPDGACDIACTGDARFACGGSWAIQLYSFPALRPGTWTYQGCVVDTPDAPAFAAPTTMNTFSSHLDLVNQCLQACARLGFTLAGVENAGQCQCSRAAAAKAGLQKAASEAECNSLCPLPGAAGFEFCGGVERLGVYKFTG